MSKLEEISAGLKSLVVDMKPGAQPNVTAKDQNLFDAALLGDEVSKSLPEGYLIRPLNITDYSKGYLDCLAQLTTVGDISPQQFQDRFKYLQQRSDEYFNIVIEELSTKRIVASGTILVESKFIRACGKVGHIEDIVVHESQRGKNFGRKIIDQLTHLGKVAGCYKIILCCDEKNVGFYEKCGYKSKEVEMVLYF